MEDELFDEESTNYYYSIIHSDIICTYCCCKPFPGMHRCKGLRFKGRTLYDKRKEETRHEI
jgi:hypothetical protein